MGKSNYYIKKLHGISRRYSLRLYSKKVLKGLPRDRYSTNQFIANVLDDISNVDIFGSIEDDLMIGLTTITVSTIDWGGIYRTNSTYGKPFNRLKRAYTKEGIC